MVEGLLKPKVEPSGERGPQSYSACAAMGHPVPYLSSRLVATRCGCGAYLREARPDLGERPC